MTGIPERSLRPHVKARREAELMQAISQESRTKKWMVPIAAAAAVVIMATGGLAVAGAVGGLRGDRDLAPRGGPEVTPSTTVTPTLPPIPDGDREIKPTKDEGSEEAPWPSLSDPAGPAPELSAYAKVLAEHLDPAGEHLETDVSGQQSSASNDVVTSIGTKLAWKIDGESGQGVIQFAVGNGWGTFAWPCETDPGWECRDVKVAGARSAQVATYDGGVGVAVEHANKQIVSIQANELFGNNTTVPVSGVDVTEEQLLAAAADPRLEMKNAVQLPPELGNETLGAVAEEVLSGPGQKLTIESEPRDRDSTIYSATGRLAGGGNDLGDVLVEANGNYGARPEEPSCLAVQYVRCVLHTESGQSVMVGYEHEKWGGDMQIHYHGPVYNMRVVAPRDLPLERAYEFVLDPRWQPEG